MKSMRFWSRSSLPLVRKTQLVRVLTMTSDKTLLFISYIHSRGSSRHGPSRSRPPPNSGRRFYVMALRNAIPKLTFVARKSLARLFRQIGKEQALQECHWMVELTLSNPLASSPVPMPSSVNLARMLARRARGEPLQYILGDF
jgi:hypothetical protein